MNTYLSISIRLMKRSIQEMLTDILPMLHVGEFTLEKYPQMECYLLVVDK